MLAAAISGALPVILTVLGLCVILVAAAGFIDLRRPGSHWPFGSSPG